MSTWRERNRDRFNELWRNWYNKNRKRKLSWQQRRREEMRQWWRAFKLTKACILCGENAPECLHFHHRDPREKDIDIGVIASGRWSKERILAEVEKCDVLCANCHMKHHWNERLLSSG